MSCNYLNNIHIRPNIIYGGGNSDNEENFTVGGFPIISENILKKYNNSKELEGLTKIKHLFIPLGLVYNKNTSCCKNILKHDNDNSIMNISDYDKLFSSCCFNDLPKGEPITNVKQFNESSKLSKTKKIHIIKKNKKTKKQKN
jgi:hypothetical protein